MYNLNEQQKEAVDYISGPLLIVAGAGTGKTTVITQKIVNLIKTGLAKPEEILALTFTDRAAAEMEERVDEMLSIGYIDLQISTFHAFCQRLLEEYGKEIGLPSRFRLLSQTDAWLLLRENIYNFNLDYYRPLGNPMGQIHALLDHFSKCRDEMVGPQEYLDYVENLILNKDEAEVQEKNRQIELANAYHKYNQLLLDNNCLDFGGLIYYTVKLLQDRPNILKLLQARYKYILVDEFQDVNWAQYEMIKLLSITNPDPERPKGVEGEGSRSLAHEERDSSATPQNDVQLTVVGDDDQAIYSFRGSNVSIIMRFMEDFKNAKEIVLTQNYRSHQDILDLAYKSIVNNNPNRLEEKLKIDKRLRHPERSESDRTNEVEGSPSSAHEAEDSSSRLNVETQNDVIEHIHCQTLDDEVRAVITKISEIQSQSVESMCLDDIAILIRANAHAEPFLNALESHGIPYEYLSSSGLYRQPIILDTMAFLNTLENIHNDRAIYRLLRLPFLDFRENDLQIITASAKKKSISYYETLKRAREFYVSPIGIETADSLINWIHNGLKTSRFEKPTVVLYEFMETSGYLKYLTHEETQGNREVIKQIYHLKQFFDLINNYESATPGAHVAGFVDHYNQIIESGDGGKMYQPEDTPDSVNILTVHGSKGLEYKYVFVVNCVEERFPTRRKSSGIDLPDEFIKTKLEAKDFHYEEERRLFYVAVTRAKEKLFLTSAEDYGGVRKKKISRFLDELGFNNQDQRSKIKDQSLTMEQPACRQAWFNNGTIKALKPKEEGDPSTSPSTPSGRSGFAQDDVKKFSFSQINSYNRCPYQYKLSHVLKIPMGGSASFSFGNTIHNTLQKFYERVQELNGVKQESLFDLPQPNDKIEDKTKIKVPDLEELLKLYEESWIADWYKSKRQREDYFAKGKEILRLFYKSQEDNLLDGTRSKWTVPVTLEGFFKIKIGEYLINGRIDRIDQLEDGSLEIIDYKTGKGKEKLSPDDKQQLLIYQIAAESLPEYYNIGKVSKLTFYYINDNLKNSFIGNGKDIEKLQEKLLDTMNKIKSGDFKATPDKHVCQYCDFKEICEFRQL